MAQPAQVGFTGTIWEAVPPEQLAGELTTGPGVTPMAETGLAYAALAVGLGEAGAEFRAILSAVGEAWGSESSEEGIAQLAQLADWFDDITTAARHNAAAAAQQAASYELAQLTMPDVGEVIDAIRTAEQMVAGSLLGAPLAGLFDAAEYQVDALRTHAAQVMRSYEAGSEPLAVAWEQEQAPAVSAGAALLAEQAPAPSVGDALGPAPDAHVVAPPVLTSLPAPDLSALTVAPTPTVMVGSESLVLSPVLSPAVPVVAGSPGPPVVAAAASPVAAPPPPLVAPTAAPVPLSAQPGPRAVAAAAADLDGRIGVDAGFPTAPAVLGGGAVAQSRSAPAPSVESTGSDPR